MYCVYRMMSPLIVRGETETNQAKYKVFPVRRGACEGRFIDLIAASEEI